MPLPEYPPARVQASRAAGVGLAIPERESDCSGERPAWYPLVHNVCDCDDEPAPDAYSGRQLSVPPPASTPYPTHDPCR